MQMRLSRVRRGGAWDVERLEKRCLLSLTALGPETLVNSFTPGNQTVAAAAMDADGDYVLVWQSNNQDGDGQGIFAQRFDADGVAQGAELQVNTFTTGAQTTPAVAMDADGDFVVAWTSDGQDGDLTGVYAQRFDAAGAPLGAEFRVNSFTTGRQSQPAVAMDSAGAFVIAWESNGQDGSGESVHAQRYDLSGVAQGVEFRVNTWTSFNQQGASVAMDASGSFVVAWDSTGQDGSGASVHAQRYSASGVAQGGEFQVNTYTTGNQRVPSIAMDADGDFVVAWESYEQDGHHFGIFAQRFGSTGAPQGDEFRVNTVTSGAQSDPVVAMNATGDFVVTWNGPDANGLGVYAQAYFASGETNDIEIRANMVVASQQAAVTVAMDDQANIIMAWQSFGADGGGYGIYARRYQALGGVISSAYRYETAPHRLQFTFDEDVSASLGTEDLVVENVTTSQPLPASDFALSYEASSNTATYTYIGAGAPGGMAGVLPDGRYRATLLAEGITTPGGANLPADYLRDFFFFGGDANHDGLVNLADFNILASNFGQSPRDFTQGDLNYDGQVNLGDFNILASRFGSILPASASTAGRVSPVPPAPARDEPPDQLDELSDAV